MNDGTTTSKKITGQGKSTPSPANGTSNGGTVHLRALSAADIAKETERTDALKNADDKLSAKIFIPAWNNKPPEAKPVISYCNTPILTTQNTAAIIAAPGMGKSSVCEAICASVLNTESDCLGFSVSESSGRVLYIDNERTPADVWNSFYRMAIPRGKLKAGQSIDRVTIAGLRNIPRLQERKAAIEWLLKEKEYGLLLLDGAGDMVTDSNDLEQAIECRIWLRELTVTYGLAIFTTIHPNPNSLKPRGHIGSEILREAESVLVIKSEGDLRIVTTDFENGKNRNNAHITGAYRWSEESKMFVGVDIEQDKLQQQEKAEAIKKAQISNLVDGVLPPPQALRTTDLLQAICAAEDCTEATAKRRLRLMLSYGLIKKHDDGLHRKIL